MSLVLEGLCLLALLSFIYFLWLRRFYYLAWYKMPGPLGLPFLGVALEILNPQSLYKYFMFQFFIIFELITKFIFSGSSRFIKKFCKQYKSPVVTWMGMQCYFYVDDPVTMELVLTSPKCINKGEIYQCISSVTGDGLFTSSCK